VSIELVLGWPSRKLSPNSRTHWRAKAPLQQAAHMEGWAETRKWLETHRPVFAETFPVTLIFCPPDRRPRDLDNLVASCKHNLDGIADALDVNDRRFRPVTADWGDVCKPGKIIVKIGI
jgi:crossover junction endodeoxyribonuclease RusA